MLLDGRLVGETTEFQADVCIVGAGAAGVTVARELIDSKLDVCLVESGGTSISPEYQELASGKNIGRTYYPLESSRLRMLGGSTGHWAGWCRPLDSIDFEKRSWVPYSGWPFDKLSLLPYYARGQEICQCGQFFYKPEEWHSLTHEPWDLTPGRGKPPRLLNRLIQFSPPTRFGEAYRDELTAAKNLRVFLHSNVLTVETDPEGSRVTGVKVRTLQGHNFTIAAKVVILACGGLETPRLMLLSDAVHKRGLGNSNDLVGRFFMNHTWFEAGGLVTSRPGLDPAFYLGRATARDATGATASVRGYLSFSRQAQQEFGITNVSLSPVPSSVGNVIVSRMENDAWYSRIGRAIGEMDEVVRGGFNAARSGMSDDYDQRVFEFINVTEQSPNPSSRVILSNETDALGQRRIALDWRMQELDLRSVVRAHQVVGSEMARLGWGRVIEAMDIESGWPSGQIGDWHHMGTTRMGHDPGSSVVDPDCRVHGTSNLYIAGSSVFPTSGYSNPTLTIVALSVRLAERIKKHLG